MHATFYHLDNEAFSVQYIIISCQIFCSTYFRTIHIYFEEGVFLFF